MARGDVRWFAAGIHDLGLAIHNLSTADWRLGVVTNATIPTVATTAPHWGGTGTTNFAASQVALGTAYTGPLVLTGELWVLTALGGDFRMGNVTIPQDSGGGFANAHWGIIFNNTDANKRAIGFLDLGGPVANTAGPVEYLWNGVNGDVLRIAQAA